MTVSSGVRKVPLRVGVVASSGGSCIKAAYDIFNKVYPDRLNLFVVTDRPCGIEAFCSESNIPQVRVVEEDNAALSGAIADYFHSQGGVDIVILFFLRLVTKELFAVFPSLNIHPSMLPDYKGFRAIERALADNIEVLGATIHMVDANVDGGDIVAQTSNSIVNINNISDAYSLSFCQKTYLVLWLFNSIISQKVNFEKEYGYGFKAFFSDDNSESPNSNEVRLDVELESVFREYMSELGYLGLLMNDGEI